MRKIVEKRVNHTDVSTTSHHMSRRTETYFAKKIRESFLSAFIPFDSSVFFIILAIEKTWKRKNIIVATFLSNMYLNIIFPYEFALESANYFKFHLGNKPWDRTKDQSSRYVLKIPLVDFR